MRRRKDKIRGGLAALATNPYFLPGELTHERQMNGPGPVARFGTTEGTVWVATQRQLQELPAWERAFGGQRKDRRYYQIVEDTIQGEYEYRYFVLEDAAGRVRAVQPFFVLRQDLIQGAGSRVLGIVGHVRKWFPRFLMMRTLMVGCVAGEAHLDGSGDDHAWVAARLHEVIRRYAKQAKVPMIVLKEFPASYRPALGKFANNGYTRVPSLPSVRLNISFATFDEYLSQTVSKATRKDLRRKFRAADDAGITMEVLTDVAPLIDELYPLYLQVFQRSRLQFEKLTTAYFCRLGREMPDKVRFFIWRQKGKAVAFSTCMISGDEIHDEYLGMDYAVALDLHLYFYTLRDIMQWAMANGFKWYCSSGQGYEPKLRLKGTLAPLDLYAAHTSPPVNFMMKRVLPLIEPTRGNAILQKFPNFAELWGDR